jgi:uncharacterized protein (DUF697 family)
VYFIYAARSTETKWRMFMSTENTEDQMVNPALEAATVSRSADAKKIIDAHTTLAATLGLIPFPIVDVAAIGAAQYKMIGDLARLYDQDTSKERVRAAVLSVLGGGVPTLLNSSSLNSLVKAIPVVGPLAGIALLPAMAGLATMALGRAFAQHFEVGGTLLSMDAKQIRAHFEAEFNGLKAKMSSKSTPAAAEVEPVTA